MDRKGLREVFNKRPRIGALSTADGKGNVNVAVFGSPQMIDDSTIIMGIGNNRSFRNLMENPKAAFIVMEPAPTAPEWKGVRIYLEAVTIETAGEFYNKIKEEITNRLGNQAGEMIKAAIRFTITEVRSLIEKMP
jgi:predicted pyridoxine 5'-phosphate oxidase superfamily flavin-nucleotide-binding protein